MGIVRVHYQGHAHGLKTAAGQLRPMGRGRGRHAIAEDMGEADAALFQQRTVFHDPRPTATTTGPLPAVLDEPGRTVRLLQRRTDAILQVHQVVFDGSHVGGIGNRVHQETLSG